MQLQPLIAHIRTHIQATQRIQTNQGGQPFHQSVSSLHCLGSQAEKDMKFTVQQFPK